MKARINCQSTGITDHFIEGIVLNIDFIQDINMIKHCMLHKYISVSKACNLFAHFWLHLWFCNYVIIPLAFRYCTIVYDISFSMHMVDHVLFAICVLNGFVRFFWFPTFKFVMNRFLILLLASFLALSTLSDQLFSLASPCRVRYFLSMCFCYICPCVYEY